MKTSWQKSLKETREYQEKYLKNISKVNNEEFLAKFREKTFVEFQEEPLVEFVRKSLVKFLKESMVQFQVVGGRIARRIP